MLSDIQNSDANTHVQIQLRTPKSIYRRLNSIAIFLIQFQFKTNATCKGTHIYFPPIQIKNEVETSRNVKQSFSFALEVTNAASNQNKGNQLYDIHVSSNCTNCVLTTYKSCSQQSAD